MRPDLDLTKILVFLPQAAGTMIVTRLAEFGYESVAVSTVPEASDALRSDEFAFAITTRPDIDVLRNIRSVPVINLEVYFHTDIIREGALVNSKRFDSKAFLERVEFLARPVAPRPDGGSRSTTPSQIPKQSSIRWWDILANTLRLSKSR